MSKVNKETARALLNIEMAISAVKHANDRLARGEELPVGTPLTVGHMISYGPGGLGKTRIIEQAAKLMGCSEEQGNFIRLNADNFKRGSELVEILQQKLSWDGYLCNHGKIDHSQCPRCNHYIVDPVNPRGPLKPQMVFLDEIHVLEKSLQEQLGLIILDFRYQVCNSGNLGNVYFPKFTFAGATTKLGDLLKPLRTRFSIKIGFNYFSDTEMQDIVTFMAEQRGLNLDREVTEIIAKVAQGTPREASNHLNGLYNCFIHFKDQFSTRQFNEKNVIMKEVAEKYISIQNFREDGLSFDQIRILHFLSQFFDEKKQSFKAVGVNRICNHFGMDPQRFYDEVEPRLSYRGFIVSGSRGRELTEEGLNYLKSIKEDV